MSIRRVAAFPDSSSRLSFHPPARPPFVMLSVGAALILQAMSAMAQSPALDTERIQREQQQRLQRQFELDRTSPRAPAQLQPDAAPRTAGRPVGPCHKISDIRLNGATLLLNVTQEALVRPYLGRCLGVNDIERLMGDVTAHYVNAGYIAARVYVGKQDLSSGSLELTVVEGVLKKLRLEEGDGHGISEINVFPWLTGKPLNLRDVEQGLDQLNRLASNNASMSIEPGQQAGESELVVTNRPAFPWHASLTVDTLGGKSTGREQGSVTLSRDNPFGFNDFLSYTNRRALDRQGGRRNSLSDSVSYTVPFGWTLLSAGLSYSSYRSTFVTPGGIDIDATGDSKNYFLRADRVVYRDRRNLLTLSGSLTRKISDNYLSGQHLTVSSRALSIGDIDLSLRTRAAGGVLFLGAGLSKGLAHFGAMRDIDNLPDTAPHARFQKERYSAIWTRQFALPKRSIDISSQIVGQRSRHVLYGSEQISVGGIYSVRGYEDSSLANDIGWTWRNDVGVTTPFEAFGHAGSWRPYAGLDTGGVRGRHHEGQTGHLSGGALGLQLRLGKASLDTFVMAPVGSHAELPRAASSVHAALSMSF